MIELVELKGRERLAKYDLVSLVKYYDWVKEWGKCKGAWRSCCKN